MIIIPVNVIKAVDATLPLHCHNQHYWTDVIRTLVEGWTAISRSSPLSINYTGSLNLQALPWRQRCSLGWGDFMACCSIIIWGPIDEWVSCKILGPQATWLSPRIDAPGTVHQMSQRCTNSRTGFTILCYYLSVTVSCLRDSLSVTNSGGYPIEAPLWTFVWQNLDITFSSDISKKRAYWKFWPHVIPGPIQAGGPTHVHTVLND